ncbi:hypothetical protein N7495_009384 [Penicillium taxi]|uniref:uncharacterized protein n=1 Tax=Penicillium taxi TaxID=168475 RepID=UPI002544FF57|nr:uncharacterized protein N7495_009384 [Penicillium taxi]KAJ5884874.1 hypothetical protein N7495_009384 [Penicillium taxi]
MFSHTSYSRAPPVRPSRSLEGLEQVVPPKALYSPRSMLFLNKPLPAKPIPDNSTEYSVMWSDSDSDSESESHSTVDSFASPSEPRDSTESYPIFVSSDSDDFMDHSAPDLSLGPIHTSPQHFSNVDALECTDLIDPPKSAASTLSAQSDPIHGRPPHWNRSATNHYFREKKWDFFPELATPSALQASGRDSASLQKKQKDGRLNVPRTRYKWHSLDRSLGLGLASNVRDSIKTYVHRTLSRDSNDTSTPLQRPSTAPGDADTLTLQQTTFQHSSTDISQLRRDSVISVVSEVNVCPSPTTRPKQLAVPMSPYQKYGPSIWETPKPKKRSIRFPSYRKDSLVTSSSAPEFTVNPTAPISSPPLKFQFQQNTREAVRAFQGAKKR